jgi:hypothetical protein
VGALSGDGPRLGSPSTLRAFSPSSFQMDRRRRCWRESTGWVEEYLNP